MKFLYFLFFILSSLIFYDCKEVPSLLEKAEGGHTYVTPWGSLYLPQGYTSENLYPLAILLHGLGDHHTSFLKGYPWREEADKRGYMLLSLRCSTGLWAETDWDGGRDKRDQRNLQQAIKTLSEELPLREDKICMIGFSAGAHFANYMVLQNNRFLSGKHYVQAFIAFSGGEVHEWWPYLSGRKKVPQSYTIPGLYCWGEKEAAQPGKRMYRLLKKQKWPVEYFTHPGHHNIPEDGISRAFSWLDRTIP